MKNKIILFILPIIFLGMLITLVYAGSEHNTSGYAWSENIGWISFNSASDGSSVNYGVNIDTVTGDLSGYAWSENIGWISFNRSDTGNPPWAPFNGGSGPIAKYNFETNEITGWMRVLANGEGWDEWIKFYNVTIDASGDWHGWAWSDMVVGWISFNSSEGGGSSYKVTTAGMSKPTVENLSVVKGNYCSSPSHYFSWTYFDADGDAQSRFRLQIDDKADFADCDAGVGCEIDRDSSNSPFPNPNEQTFIVAESPNSNQLAYNTIYYWRVNVWDSNGIDSGWTDGPSFTTESHRYPLIDFSWLPVNPSKEEDVQFTDSSDCFDADGDCDNWSWHFTDGSPENVVGADQQSQNPIIKFTSDESKPVTLEVTDSSGYTCPETKNVDVNIELPGWREILPW